MRIPEVDTSCVTSFEELGRVLSDRSGHFTQREVETLVFIIVPGTKCTIAINIRVTTNVN